MKIGAFAKKNNAKIDAIRHYIDLELLLPQKKNNQYEFDEQCESDFNEIMFLKSLGFTLHEIKNIFVVKHLSKMTPYQQDEYYQNIYREKYDQTKTQIDKLYGEQAILQAEINKLLVKSKQTTRKIGIPLNSMQLLSCDRCGESLDLKEATIEDNMIMSGKLRCKCKREYTVSDGILFASEDISEDDFPMNISAYIQNTDDEYLNVLYKTLEWSAKHVSSGNLSGKVLLELGSGSGFFLRRIYDHLPENSVYIATDRDPGKLRFLKGILEKAEKRSEILFICCDFPNIPLKPRCVDTLYDITGTSNFSFEHKEFLITLIEKYLKADVELLGSYIIFKNFSKNCIVPPDFRPNFKTAYIKKQIEELGITMQDEYTSDVITKGGIYEDYFCSDEKVLDYNFAGKRLG